MNEDQFGTLSEILAQDFTHNIAPPCTNCDITSITPDLTNTAGQSVNMDTGPMMHHIVLYDQTGPDQACGSILSPAEGMRRIFASGNERTAIPIVPGYGLYIASGEKWAMDSDLMNYSNVSQTVQVRLYVTYVAGNTLKPVTPVWLDSSGPCGISFFNVPKGVSDTTSTWTSNLSGTVVGMGGHEHENGVYVSATDTTTNTVLCKSVESQMSMVTPIESPQLMVTGMSTCIGSAPSYLGQIHVGDKIVTDANYDTPAAQVGVMGIMIMYVYQGG
jgi:hypothetical protein